MPCRAKQPHPFCTVILQWTTLVTDSKSGGRPEKDVGDSPGAFSSLDDVLAACRNHNATSRREGLAHLVSFMARDAANTQLHQARIMSAIADRIVDPEAPVRAATVAAFETILGVCPPATVLSFVPLLAAYLASALSKLQPSLRLDAMSHVYCLAEVRGRGRAGCTHASVPSGLLNLLLNSLHGIPPSALCSVSLQLGRSYFAPYQVAS